MSRRSPVQIRPPPPSSASSAGERRPDTAEAAGSIPAPDTEPSTNRQVTVLSSRKVPVRIRSALLDPSWPNRQGGALLMRRFTVRVRASERMGWVAPYSSAERALRSHRRGPWFDPRCGDCGRSSVVERQVVTLEAPVQLRPITPSERADDGESGPAVTRSHVCSGGSSPPARTMPA